MGVSSSKFVVYLKGNNDQIVPIEYPDTLEKLKLYLALHYKFEPSILHVHESSEYIMNVSTETSYRALVPKHKVVEPNMNVYYIIVILPFAINATNDVTKNKK
jgi:hypothetical protein